MSSQPLGEETEEWHFEILMLLYRVEENLLRLVSFAFCAIDARPRAA